MTIRLSHKHMDTAFVSKAIAELKLNPSPTIGFVADPTYWQETDRWLRSVERHDWGVVIFMLDRDNKRAATLVCVGKVDLDAGKVTVQGGHTVIPVNWYTDLVQGLKAAARPESLAIPQCLGFREADHICDGGLIRALNKLSPPCLWRDRCMALQEHAAKEGRPQERVLAGKSPSQIVQLTTRLLERKHPAGHPSVTPAGATRPAAATAQPLAAGATPKPSDGAKATLVQDLRTAVNEVAEGLGLKVAADWTQATAAPGDLYLVDRLAASSYVSVYQADTPPKALASFRVRPRLGGFNVQLPLPKESPHLAGINKDEVRDHKDGKFLSMVMGVQPGSRRIEHVKYAMMKILEES